MLRKWKSTNKYHKPVRNLNEAFQNRMRAKMTSTVWRPIRGVRASLGNKGMAPFKDYSVHGKLAKRLPLK